MKKIVVAVDGSESAAHAASLAASLAQASGAELLVTTSVVPVAYPTVMMLPVAADFDAAQLKTADLILADTQKRLSFANPTLKISTKTLSGAPAEAVADLAAAEQADLVVVGSRGRGALARMILGSVANRLVHACSRPVLVVR